MLFKIGSVVPNIDEIKSCVEAVREIEKTDDGLFVMHDDYEKLQKQNAWQPIETAPKDKPVIGLFYSGGIECIRKIWFLSAKDAVIFGEGPDDEGWWSMRNSVGDEMIEPTHWLPIPEYPKQ